MLNITIIGHGFVGKAVDYAFQYDVKKQIIDPKYNNDENYSDINSDITFVCVPTPMSENGTCNTYILENILNKFNNKYKIVIAPGPSEISQSKDFNATCVLDKNLSLIHISEPTRPY